MARSTRSAKAKSNIVYIDPSPLVSVLSDIRDALNRLDQRRMDEIGTLVSIEKNVDKLTEMLKKKNIVKVD